jgi:hypothetical protein
MTDENEDLNLEDDKGKGTPIPDSQAAHDEWEPNAEEQKAMAGGWRPEHEWEGDPEDWVRAREFNRVGDLMSRITSQGRQLGALEGKFAEAQKLISASDRVTQRLVKEAVAKTKRDLKAQRRSAMEEGDHAVVDEIDEQLDELKDTEAELKATAQDNTQQASADQNRAPTPVEAAWFTYVNGAEWMKDPAKGTPMLKHAQDLVNAQPHITVDDFMDSVLDKSKELRGVKKPSRSTPPAGPDDKGTGRQRRSKTPTEASASSLTEQQRELGKGYVAEGLYKDLNEYAKARAELDLD